MGEKGFVNSKQLHQGRRPKDSQYSLIISQNPTLTSFLGQRKEPREEVKKGVSGPPHSAGEILGQRDENYGHFT